MNSRQQKQYNLLAEMATTHGVIIISERFENTSTRMIFKLPCSHEKEVMPDTFKRSPIGCLKCPQKTSVVARKNFEDKIIELGGKVIGSYVNDSTKVDCICANDHSCAPVPGKIKIGQGMCKKCAGTCPIESEKNFIINVEKLGGKVIGNYVDSHSHIECICINDHQCFPTPTNVSQGQGMCGKCASSDPIKAESNFRESITNFGGQVIGEYVNSTTRVKCICPKGHNCNPTPSGIRSGDGMCPECSQRCPIAAERNFREIVSSLGGIVKGDYVAAKLPIHCICKEGHDCYPDAAHLQDRGSFCSTCTILSNESYGSALVAKGLDILGIKYEREIRHPHLQRLRFDFSFTHNDKLYYIEYDGTQHQEYDPFMFPSEEAFKNSRQRDLMKNYIVKRTDCILIRIDHTWEHNRRPASQPMVESKMAAHIQACLDTKGQKIIADPEVYDWIDDEPNEDTINRYIKLYMDI